jgi:hypothetical protein
MKRKWFHFKSYEGLFCKADGSPRQVKMTLLFSVKNIKVKGDEGKDLHDLQGVESWKIIDQYDTLKNTAEWCICKSPDNTRFI